MVVSSSVIMCDVDHFKKINDTHGHLDRRRSAEVVRRRSCRQACVPADWVARYGGEEFVIVLPETNVVNAAIAAEHLREQIAASTCPCRRCRACRHRQLRRLRMEWPRPQGATLDALIARCDAGVYASKAADAIAVTMEAMD